MVRVAINGFGRIGRQVLQAGIRNKKITWVAVNDLTDTKTLAHLLKYDSVHGVSHYKVTFDEKNLYVDGNKLIVLAEKEPSKLPWKHLKIDIVVESTGFFTEKEGAALHLAAGAKKVLITAPSKNADITIVKGVNEHLYESRKHKIISNASCTTNCLAPIVYILHKAFGVRRGFMATAHAYTADQRLVDAPHKDLRRARSAALSIVPTTTGAAKTVGEVIPELRGMLDGFAWRIPVADGSIVNFVSELGEKTDIKSVNELFRKEAKRLAEILEYSEEPLVSADIIHNPHSCIFDALSTNVIEGNFVSVCAWYDNEWGYSCRVVDMLEFIGKKL